MFTMTYYKDTYVGMTVLIVVRIVVVPALPSCSAVAVVQKTAAVVQQP